MKANKLEIFILFLPYGRRPKIKNEDYLIRNQKTASSLVKSNGKNFLCSTNQNIFNLFGLTAIKKNKKISYIQRNQITLKIHQSGLDYSKICLIFLTFM